ALVVSSPVLAYLLFLAPGGAGLLAETLREYAAFMALLGALFVISGGIYLRGAFAGTPAVNTAFLAAGALLASLVGTTGASALLIRPLLRANRGRRHLRHIVVFFIFIVSNGGRLLTPLRGPPLFLRFLRGVPSAWPLPLLAPWAAVNGTLLVVLFLCDRFFAAREGTRAAPRAEPLAIEGKINLVWLAGVIATVFLVGALGLSPGLASMVQIAGMTLVTVLSLKTTRPSIHDENHFSWAPMIEVATIFVGVFLTMVPALAYLEENGARVGVIHPWQFFWASGALSSVLDNAPTYLTFASLAIGVADGGAGFLSASDLGALAAHPVGERLLAAVSCGSVFMGAITYIGNGPNFMVKAIAEQHHVH